MTNRLISHSEVEMYSQCERKHYYAFGKRLQPKGSSVALQTGNAGHAMLEVFLNGVKEGQDPNSINILDHPKLAEIDLTPKATAQALVTYWIHNVYPHLGWKIVKVEEEFRVPIREGLVYPFKIDLIVQDFRHKLYIVDHKFTSDAYSDPVVSLLPQIPRYMAGLRKLGINIEGGIYNFFRTRSIKNPAERYVQKPVVVSEARRQESMADLMRGMDKILAAEQDKAYVPTRTTTKMNCDNCGFQSLCFADLEQRKTEFLEKTAFEPNTYGYKED